MSYFRSFTGCSRIVAAMITLLFAANASAQCYIVENALSFVVDGGTFGPSGLTAGDCLNEAIRDIPSGGTVRLRIGTGQYFIVRAPMVGTPEGDERTGLRFIDKVVTIEAFNPAASPLDAIISADTTLGAVPDYRLFNVRGQFGELTLNRVTLENGRSLTPGQTNGGAIKHDSLLPLRLTDCIIRDNIAGTRGGGIWSQNICLLENVLFVNNRADPTNVPGNPGESIRGGGLYHAPGKPLGAQIALSMMACRFHCNTSLEEGGGMWLGGGYQRRVSNCEFYGNAATVSGGAMTANGTTFPSPNPPTLDWLQFDDCRFGAANSVGAACDSPAYRAGNSAGIDGGAVQLVDNAQPIYIRCTFENNRILAGSNGRGGAIYISSVGGNNPNLPRSAVFIESLFLRNQSFNTGQTPAGEGGAVFIRESSSPYFLDCGFVENASRLGGGMHVIGGSNPRMYNCVFSRNSVGGAGPQGSAIWANASSPQLLHCSLLSPIGSPLVWLNSVSATPMQLTGSIVWGNGPGGPNRAFGGNGVVLLDPALTANPQALFSDLDVDVPGRFADQSVDPARTSNINCDPLVANAPINDVHLTNCSPCIDRADHLLAGTRYLQIFANPLATFGFSFALITGAPENEQSDFDYDDDFLPPQGAFHNDASGPRPRNPRLATSGGPVACEADMGADESIRDITDSITLFCDPASDGQPPLEIASADACSPFGVGEACGPLCEGEQLCLTGVFDGLCPTGVVYQWYFRDDANNDPAFCGPLTTEFVPVVNNGRITGANTPNLCFTDVELCDTGCYRLIITRSTCGGPSRFFCAEDLATGLATSICGDELTVDVCISVYQAPEIQVHPLPATVCLGGTQNLCATVQVPVGCEPQCIWYRVVGTPDNVNTPGFPFDDVRVCPLQAPLAGITCNDTPLGGGLFACCLTFSPATINHIGDYYVVVTCGGLECSVQSDPAELEVIDPQPLVNNAAVCVGGRQCLEQVAVLPPLTPGSTYTYQWFRRPESDCLTTPCPAGDCSAGTPLTNSGPFSGVNTPVLCIDPASTALRGCYYVVVGIDGLDVDSLPDDGKCVSASNCACLTVIDPFPVVADAAVCLGGTQTLEQTATLPALPAGYTYTFQWFFRGTSNCLTTPCPAGQCGGGTTVSNGGRFSGANTPNLTITNAMAVDAGCYYISVGIDGPEGPAIDAAKCLKSSNCACLSVVNPQPVVNNAAVCLGGTQTLEQVASLPSLPAGYTYTFQWFFRGTSNCITTPCELGDCTGGAPVSNGGRFSGANTPNLTITGAFAADAGCYYVRVGIDGPEGSAIDAAKCIKASNCACLAVVNPLPTVNDAAVCLGGTQALEQTATLPSLPSGYAYTFQWFFRGTSNCITTPCPAGDCTGGTTVPNSGRFSGANTPTLTITNAMAADAGCYYIVVSLDGPEGPGQDGPKCAKASNCACLSVVNPQPLVANAAACLGGTQTLEQTATLPPLPAGYTYTFQWFFRGTSNCITTPCPAGDCTGGTTVPNSGRFSGANTPNLTITGALAADAGCYYVSVGIDGPEGPAIDAGKCLKNSNCACLSIVDPIPLVANAAVCIGGTQTLEQTATLPTLPAGYTYTFQWFFRGTSNCIATPCPAGDCTGGTAVSNSGRFSGANTPSLTISNAMAIDAGCYYVSVGIDGPEGPAIDAAKCVKNSNCACLVVVNPLPVVANAAVCLGGTQTLEQTAVLPALPVGYAYTFQWFFRGTSNCITTPCPAGDCTGGTTVPNSGRFSGANTPTLTITNAMAADAGCYYIVVSLDGPEGPGQDGPKCAKASNCACLSVVNPQPMVANAAACLGGRQCLEVSTLPALPAGYSYTYQWFRLPTSNCLTTPCQNGACSGGTELTNSGGFSGVTTPILCIDPAIASHQGCYYVRIGIDGPEGPAQDGPKCMVVSNCACLSVIDPVPVVASRTVCIDGDQCLSVNVGAFPALPANYTYTFQWFFIGNADCIAAPCPGGACSGGSPLANSSVYSGVTTPTLCLNNAQLIHQGCYYVQVGINGPEDGAIDAAKCLRFSNCACLRVLPQPTFTLQPEPAAVCVGGRQTLTANVTNPGGLSLCLQWYRKTSCSLQGEGVPVVDGSGISGATTNTLTFDPASLDHEGCYYLRARLCEPNDLSKCPWVDSTCACLDVRPPLVPCVLECVSGESDSAGNCLFCPGVDITLCCDVVGTEGPVCYQWQFCADSGPAGCFIDIPSANSACFIIENFNPAIHTGCYRVRINYLDLSGGLGCPDSSDKCDAVYSLPICVAETDRCCPDVCDCKDNADPTQPFYALWKTGEWDGQSGEWSFDRSTTDGIVIKAADDFFLCPSSMHHITRFLGEMLVRQSNPLIEFQAKLFLYEDCDGQPGEQIAEFDSDCPAFVSGAPDGFTRYQVKFDLSEECFWLRGGTYWVSLVAIAPPADASFEAFWAGVGLPGTPPIPTVMGRQPVFMDGDNDWAEYDPCCHPCADLQFCLSGKSCPIMWDNGLPFLGGADSDSPPSPPFQVRGTRSEKSALPVRNSRAADQFIVKTCNPEEVCYLEGYIFTNCIGFEAHLEIYESDCRVPQFELPQASPVFYSAIADPANIIDLGYTGLQVGTTAVRAYKVIFCAFDPGLTFEPGRNYWVSLSVKDSFSANERAFFAHVKTPCDPCTEPYVWKVDPGMELAPGRQIPDWRSAGEDFAFLIATKKQPGTSPIGGPGEGDLCIADANNNNEIDVQDIFVFLSAWFAGCP